MSDPKEEFVASAVRPIQNQEQKLGLWRWLGELVGEGDDASWVQATQRWNEIDARGSSGRAHKLVMMAMVLGAILTAIPLLNTGRLLRQNAALVGRPGWGGSFALKIGEGLGAKERLLLGDPTVPTLVQKQALIQSEPGNAAFFAEYAVAYYDSHLRLPHDYLVTANLLDPENAWFDYFAAATTAANAVEKIQLTRAEEKSETPPRWQINDPARVMEALELLRLAKEKSRFQSYEETLLRQRIPLLPQSNPGEHFASYLYLCGDLSRQITLRSLADVIAASAWQAGEMRDAEYYHEVSSDARDLLGNLSKLEDITLAGELVHRAAIARVSPNLRAAAEQLGLDSEANYWRKVEVAVKRYNEGRNTKSRAYGGMGTLMQEQGNMLVSYAGPMVSRQVEEQVPVTVEDLKPGRMSNHRFLSAMSSRAGWLLLASVAAAAALYRFRGSPALRLLSMRGAVLLGKGDWLWLAGGAVLAPMAFALAITLFSPVGISDAFIDGDRTNQLLGRYLVVALLLIILPVLIARWRFSVRARAFGFTKASWMGWVSIVSLILFVPCLPYYLHLHGSWRALVIAHVAIAVGWVPMTAGIALFGKSRGVLRRLMVAHAVLPIYLLGMFAMAILSSWLLASSQTWFEKDQFGKLTAEAPAAMPYEYRVAKQLKKEIKEMVPAN